MEDVCKFFCENEEAFTVYVVEQRFALGRGHEYFKSFKGKNNLIDSDIKCEKLLHRIVSWMSKKIPEIGSLIGCCFGSQVTSLNIADIISCLSKLFGVESHQAAGPYAIDPIIIEEGNVLPQYVTKLINLHKESVLRPTIIIILKDNDFERACRVLSDCPNGTCVKLIRNSGESSFYRVVNTGAKNVESFIEAFAQQYFSTCSCTPREVLLNDQWDDVTVIKHFAPTLMKIRSSLLCDEKSPIKSTLDDIVTELFEYSPQSDNDAQIVKVFQCVALLNGVFCDDYGGEAMVGAMKLANEVDCDVLQAQTYRYAHFIPGISRNEELQLLSNGQKIFEANKMMDQALYCRNNRLIRQFETEHIHIRDFLDMRQVAVSDVPGLVGMAHIFNNLGVAQLMTGMGMDAIDSFKAGLDYAREPERAVQKIALLSNLLLAKAYNLDTIDEKEFYRTMNLIRDNMGTRKLPFLAARYAMNVIASAYAQSEELGVTLARKYSIKHLLQEAMVSKRFGTGQLALQMGYLQEHYTSYHLLDTIRIPSSLRSVTGSQRAFIERNGFNPVFFSTWL